jgi:hypothetical protein
MEVDAVVIGGGVEATSVQQLIQHFRMIDPDVLIHQHTGGPHGFQELLKQLKQIFFTKPKP